MAKGNRNVALIEAESLTPEETSLMEDNRRAQYEPEPESTPEPVARETPAPTPAPVKVVPETVAKEPAALEPAPVVADDKPKMVDQRALHEERERRKEERNRREKAEQDLAKLTGRFATLEELARAAAQQQAPKPEVPDVNTDPVAHFQHELRQRDEKIAQFENWQRQQQAQAQQQQQISHIRQYATQAETDFSRDTPDYTEAATYVQMVRNAQLEAIGITDQGQRAQQLAMEALNLAAGAQQRGQNPAAIIYQMAKASGWKAKAAEVPVAPAPVVTTPVTTPVPAPSPAVPADGAKKLATVAKGQAANASLSQLNGGAQTETSVESLLKMSDEEFSAATKGDNWRKLFA